MLLQGDAEIADAGHHILAHALRDGEGVRAVEREPHIGLEQELVVLDAPLAFARPFAELVAQNEPQCVLLAVPVGVFRVHEHIEVLRLEVGGVAHMHVHVEILHRVGDIDRECQRFLDVPLLVGQVLDVAVKDILVARGANQNDRKYQPDNLFHSCKC